MLRTAVALIVIGIHGQLDRAYSKEPSERTALLEERQATASVDDDAAARPHDSLAAAIADAYRSNPILAAERYELRVTDDALGAALAGSRATVRAEISAGYQFTSPGDITQAKRPLVDRLNAPNIHQNDFNAEVIVDQPLSTGGRAAADIAAARSEIRAGRQSLRGTEGDLIFEIISAYADVRRDGEALQIRTENERSLVATLDEVRARREAGELTLTDVAQAETQLQSARVQRNAAEAQLEESRSTFTALVGREPGRLAPEPPLPFLPGSPEEAFEAAEQYNPDLAAATEKERASRARIAAARAERRPTIGLRGTAGASGPVSPFYGHDQDLYWSGRAVVTVPLSAGGRTAAGIAQALDRNSADRLRIEASRRRMVQQIVSSWNRMATASRNYTLQQSQFKSAQIYYEGTYEEYRAGLRSTFDVLYAQNSLREAEIALLASRRDQYVSSAALLRQQGQLEVGKLLTGAPLYDPERHLRSAEARGAMPWDPVFRAIDALAAPGQTRQRVEALPRNLATPQMIPAVEATGAPELIRQAPIHPRQGTSPMFEQGEKP